MKLQYNLFCTSVPYGVYVWLTGVVHKPYLSLNGTGTETLKRWKSEF